MMASNISVDDVVVGEGRGFVDIVVRLDAPLSTIDLGLGLPDPLNVVTVAYSTSTITATKGVDFSDVSGTLTFTANEIVKTVRVTITDDLLAESVETFSFNLSNPSANATIARSSAIGTIIDNDLPTVVLPNGTTGVTINGTAGNDTINGVQPLGTQPLTSSLIDTVFGFGGNDMIMGLGGNDVINGGDGIDIAQYRGARSGYVVGGNAASRTVTDNTGQRDGADTLTGVERLQFTDGILALDTLRTDNAGRGYLIYRAAFDRTPDTGGLGYWIGELDRGQDFGAVVAASFIASPEFIGKYGSNTSNATFLNLVYQNVLDRAPDQAGNDYWMGQLNAGYSRSNMLASFAISDENVNSVAPLIIGGIFYTLT